MDKISKEEDSLFALALSQHHHPPETDVKVVSKEDSNREEDAHLEVKATLFLSEDSHTTLLKNQYKRSSVNVAT